MKQALRYFSLGLLSSALLLLVFSFLFGNSTGKNAQGSVEKMIAAVEAEGYHVLTEDDYITYTFQKEQPEEKAQKEEKDDNKDKEDEEKSEEKDKKKDSSKKEKKKSKSKKDKKDKDKVEKVNLKIKDGMYTPQIADILVENNIIDDRKKFIDYMDDNGYSEYIQLGKFEVKSDMSLKEIAEKLTTYPGD